MCDIKCRALVFNNVVLDFKMNKELISEIRKELKNKIEPAYRKNSYRFFKEKVKILGVRTHAVRKIAGAKFTEIKNLPKKEIFALCEEFLKSGVNEEVVVAFEFASRLKKQYTPADFKIFESWFKKYISNWGNCDGFCTRVLGEFLFEFPEFLPKLKLWANSRNRWVRRASAVALIYSLRRKIRLKEIFEIADILLRDKDEMVLKGYGWALKEASNKYPKEVFNFVSSRKRKMPRSALRYAIEKLPKKMKQKAAGKILV